MSAKSLIVPKESVKRTLTCPSLFEGVEHKALLAESIVASEENPFEKTQRMPDDEGNLCTSAKMRTCELGKSGTSVETETIDTWLPGELETKVIFEAND